MCEPLGKDFGVSIIGQPDEVLFTVLGEKTPPTSVEIQVDWEVTASARQYSQTELMDSGVLDLANAVAQAIQVWYNVTELEPSCINWEGGAAPNMAPAGQRRGRHQHTAQTMESATVATLRAQQQQRQQNLGEDSVSTLIERETNSESLPSQDGVCSFPSPSTMDAMTAWNGLVCNEGINLVNWWAQGTGKDMYWPPNRDRNATLKNQVRNPLCCNGGGSTLLR